MLYSKITIRCDIIDFLTFLSLYNFIFQVSWLKRPNPNHVPDLLTFGETVYVNDARVVVRKQVQTNHEDVDWKLEILHSKLDDSGLYMCQVSTEPPQIHKIYLLVEGT